MQEEFHNEPSEAGLIQDATLAAVAISFAVVLHASSEVALGTVSVQDSSLLAGIVAVR